MSGAPVLLGSDRALESWLWSPRRLKDLLAATPPDVVVFSTLRSYDERVVPSSSSVVLDFVDQLSVNYRRRAGLARNPTRKWAFGLLAGRMAQLERRPTGGAFRTAAGREDAALLGADWIPNVIDVPDAGRGSSQEFDLLFIGSLGYGPNVEAVRTLARIWPSLHRRRPGTSLLLAGSRPSPDVLRMAQACRWEVAADFLSLAEICARGRVAVAPLATATGIQNKVLEAAAHGVPQVVHPAVVRGLGPTFPALLAGDDRAWVEQILRLIEDEQLADELGNAAREYVAERFSARSHLDWCEQLLLARREGRAPA